MKKESNETKDFSNVKPELHVRRNGYDYILMKIGKRAMLYEQIITKDVKRYEVSLVKIKKARTIKGKQIPSKIWFPNNEAFGVWAWTFMTYEAALWRYNELEDGMKRRDFTCPYTTKKIYYEPNNIQDEVHDKDRF